MALKMSLNIIVLLLSLSCFTSAESPKSAKEIDRALLAGTTGKQIHVREYRIMNSGEWIRLRDLSFPAHGPVEVTSMTPPDSNGGFSLYYSYWDQHKAQSRRVRIDQKKFKVVADTPLHNKSSSYVIATFQANTTSENNQRLVFFTNKWDIAMQKIQSTSGKPFSKKTKLFDRDPTGSILSAGFSPNGTNMALLYTDYSVFYGGIFHSLSNPGKPIGEPALIDLDPFVQSIRVGAGYDWPDGSRSYTLATSIRTARETGVFLTRFDATTNQPIDGPVTVSPLDKIAKKNRTSNVIWIYDLSAKDNVDESRSWIVYGIQRENCDKLQIVFKQFHPRTLEFGATQTLIGCNDRILKKARYFTAISGVTYKK